MVIYILLLWYIGYKWHLSRGTDATGDITMLVYLQESVTNTNYNGIVRSDHDFKTLIQNFITMMKEQYGLDSDKLNNNTCIITS